ncbi:unnamed protein product, partial [marine sediment metagenome]
RGISFIIYLGEPGVVIQLSVEEDSGYKYSEHQINAAFSRGWKYRPEVETSIYRYCGSMDNFSVITYIVRESVLAFCMIWNIQQLPMLHIYTIDM